MLLRDYFRIDAGMVTYPAGATLGPRRLHDYEFVYLHSGTIRWIIDDQEHNGQEGCLILMKPGTEDYIMWDQNRSTTHSFVHFSCREEGADVSHWPSMIFTGSERIVEDLMLQIVQLFTAGNPDANRVLLSAISHLIHCFIAKEASLMPNCVENLPIPIDKAFQYLCHLWNQKHFSDPGVEQLAAASGVTSVHLNRLFRQLFGLTAGQAVRGLRMTHAADLIHRSNYKIQEIAEMVGAADPYHFCKQFKLVYGISPRMYRNLANRGEKRPPSTQLNQLKQAFRSKDG